MDRADSHMSQGDLKPQQSSSKNVALELNSRNHEKSFESRCQPDLFDSNVVCTANDTRDHRRYVSHFFGRNKLHTATIPHAFFPMLCRKHYQDRIYRHDPGAYAAFQCDSILKVLGKMTQKILTDDHGNEWPWWCGFELRLPILVDTEPPSMSMPSWLSKMCLEANEDSDEPSEAPGRFCCDLLQLVHIVKALRIWCADSNSVLPPIQALPVTIGMIDKQALKNAEKIYKKIDTQSNFCRNDKHRLEKPGRVHCTSPGSVQRVRQVFERSLQEVESTRQNFVFANLDFKASAITFPAQREVKSGSGRVPKCSSSEEIVSVRAQQNKRKRSREPCDGNGKRTRTDQTET